MRFITFLLLLVASQAWAQFASPRNLSGSATSTCSTANAVLYNAATPCSAALTYSGTAGDGLTIAAGTAATNARRALSISQTWTDGTSSNIGIVGNFDMGATGTATGKLLSLQAGAAGTTEAFAVSQNGTITFTSSSAGDVITATGVGGGINISGTGGDAIYTRGVSRFGSTGYLAFTLNNNMTGGDATSLSVISAGVLGVGTGTAASIAGGMQMASIGFNSGKVAVSATAPTIASGGCTSPTVTNNNGTAYFTIDVGTSCSGSQPVVFTLPAATTGWHCYARNVTNGATSAPAQTGAISTTSVTITNFVRTTGVAGAWTDGDDVTVSCLGG